MLSLELSSCGTSKGTAPLGNPVGHARDDDSSLITDREANRNGETPRRRPQTNASARSACKRKQARVPASARPQAQAHGSARKSTQEHARARTRTRAPAIACKFTQVHANASGPNSHVKPGGAARPARAYPGNGPVERWAYEVKAALENVWRHRHIKIGTRFDRSNAYLRQCCTGHPVFRQTNSSPSTEEVVPPGLWLSIHSLHPWRVSPGKRLRVQIVCTRPIVTWAAHVSASYCLHPGKAGAPKAVVAHPLTSSREGWCHQGCGCASKSPTGPSRHRPRSSQPRSSPSSSPPLGRA